jgi:hypothetical protein
MTKGFLRFLRGNTIALIALFLALGGTTYAASTALIGKNTVASPQVVNGSLQTKDLSKKARKALKGNRGLRGAQGAPGTAGAAGAKGATGAQGPVGPSVTYQNHVAANLSVSNSAGTPTTINSLVLPGPATYLVTASGSLFDSATAPSTCGVFARITRNGTQVGDHAELGTSHPTAGDFLETSLSMQRLLSVTGASQTIAVTAYRFLSTGTCTFFNRTLTAIQVGSGNGTLAPTASAPTRATGVPAS